MQLQINGIPHQVEAEADTPLLWVIRDELGMTGTKYGCGLAQCGACSVLVDGAVVRSCVVPVGGMAGRSITTIEAIESDDVGRQVVAAWVKHQVPQCGYCQSGQVMAATALLKQVAHPTEAQIAASMVNLCRCGTYNAISAAVHDLATRLDAVTDLTPAVGLPCEQEGTAAVSLRIVQTSSAMIGGREKA
jgi:isoquinoline 1-oxidoreductase alpha subunit